jgi:hypothetical protein
VDGLDLTSVLLAVGGTVAAGATFLIIVRNARTKGRRAALAEADAMEALVAECREQRVRDAATIFDLRMTLSEHGLGADPREQPP